MRLKLLTAIIVLIATTSRGQLPYPVHSKTLGNGLKIIVCEKNTTPMVQIEVWYRVGSKDEWDGIRGMAHLFEHMMFRGSKKFNGKNSPDKIMERLGGQMNAYTTYDRTVYHEEVPADSIKTLIAMEADRMENLVLDQKLLDTEREVVGEELRLGQNRWYNRMHQSRYALLYPDKHPYKVDVIGYLEEITAFTTQQCQDFYDKYYSPNNAFVILTGNVKAANIFALCETYFGGIKKQLPTNLKKAEPDIFNHVIQTEEMTVDFPVQIYSYVIPSPAFGHKDYYAFNLFSELLFSSSNSLLKRRLVDKNLAYDILGSQDLSRMYNAYTVYDIVMQAGVGNAKVMKEVEREINQVLNEGVDEADLKAFLSNMDRQIVFEAYSNSQISGQLGLAEYYHLDHNKYGELERQYRKVSIQDLAHIAETYFNPAKMKIINIKPTENE